LISFALGVIAGYTVCPTIKPIWTPSWVLVNSGFTLWFLAAFYWAADLKGWKRLLFPLTVVGMNSMAMYLMIRLQGLALEGRRDPRPRPFLVNAVRYGHFNPLDDLLLDVSEKGFYSTLALLSTHASLSKKPRTILCCVSSLETIQERQIRRAPRGSPNLRHQE
jgi:hypothetical protein